jgi:hypothetical protein
VKSIPVSDQDPIVQKVVSSFSEENCNKSIISRVAERFIKASYFKPGDIVLYGKYKNHKGIVRGFGQDKWGNPTIEIEPIPKGRKQNKIFGLFRVWRADVKEKALAEQKAQELDNQLVNRITSRFTSDDDS